MRGTSPGKGAQARGGVYEARERGVKPGRGTRAQGGTCEAREGERARGGQRKDGRRAAEGWTQCAHTAPAGPSPRLGPAEPALGRRWAGRGCRAQALTEQSFLWVWMQPERSFWTQQPESRSRSRSRSTSCSICWSFRMQGENLAPRWIKSIWGGGRRGGGCELRPRPGQCVPPEGAPAEQGFQVRHNPPLCPAGGDRGRGLPAEMPPRLGPSPSWGRSRSSPAGCTSRSHTHLCS